MKIKNKNLNFSLKLLCFSALVLASYFFLDSLQYIAIIPVLICLYDGFKIFKKIKDSTGLRIAAFLSTAMALVLIIHIMVADGISAPVPMLLMFIISNLFFIYNVIIYMHDSCRKLSFILLIILWVICDSIPVLMILILSAGLTS